MTKSDKEIIEFSFNLNKISKFIFERKCWFFSLKTSVQVQNEYIY